MKWQPIETAPKDGTSVLIWNGRAISVAKWGDTYTEPWVGQIDGADGAWNDFDEDPLLRNVTHWMPLPEPPE